MRVRDISGRRDATTRSRRWPPSLSETRNVCAGSDGTPEILAGCRAGLLPRSLGSFRCLALHAKECVQDDEGGADGDGRIGDVEGGVMVGAEPDFEEVGDGTVEDAIGDIAGRSAKEKSEASSGGWATAVPGNE